jgi:hypothetical protein
MPYRSKAQERWGNSPAGKKALGAKGVNEWNAASKGLKLPERVKPVKKSKEVGIPKGASKAVKAKDDAYDRKHKLKEGGKADLKADRKLMKSSKKGK